MQRAGKIVFITIAVWLAITVFYGYYWVTSILAQPDNYGYEKWVMFPLMGFLVYRFPYLVVGLLLIILTELVLTAVFRRKAA
jgi:hypothetical protein